MNPFRRTAFDELKRLGDWNGCGQRKQDVNVILNASDFDGNHFVLTRNAAEKWPQPLAEFGRDERTAFLGAEHAMEIGTDVGHTVIQPSLWDLCNSEFSPGVETPGYSRDAPSGQIQMTARITKPSRQGTRDEIINV